MFFINNSLTKKRKFLQKSHLKLSQESLIKFYVSKAPLNSF